MNPHRPGRRVAVTGVGLLTALGEGGAETWKGLLEGRSGIGPIRGYDASALITRHAAELPGFRPQRYADRRSLRMTTRNDHLAIAGAALAMADAGLTGPTGLAGAGYDPERAGLFVGGNKEISNPEHLLSGSLAARDEQGRADFRLLGERMTSAFHPLYYVEGLQSAALFHLSHAHGFKGPNAYFHGTSDAGAAAIARAYRAVRAGECRVALAGGADDAASWWSMTRMDGLGVLATADLPAERVFRPYDEERSGSVLGDGAAFLVLEDLDAARRRGATVYAEIRGTAATRDGGGLITPEPDGGPLAAAVERALDTARVPAAEVSYVAAHGCGTRLGDRSESRALARVFGPGSTAVASSVKPATGHLVAGAGALNVAVCALALDAGAVPPTLNLDRPDQECRALDWVPREARELRLRHTVAIARGLEGQQVALVLSDPEER
ncbi:beta-ketoacyl-[acyl-carrier-protein] synthase family protein [Streptomyces sp. NRRL WC-3742]|uniref:beta-ketoacyl-[acyl-carrier-protein] synthase family protein n=1 Tax=Streptomyces sp. NRRL WC-3742 TaxID=1463934 RepID=UPI0004CBF3BC|nr:beta-ketoacyl synthase N-terminal-like domain-containing protein [Streptomyces sp. NRRL WC-3742]